MEGLGFVIFWLLIVPGFILFVCWIVLPFAIVGTKPILRELRDELRRANAIAERQTKALEWVASNTEKLPPPVRSLSQ